MTRTCSHTEVSGSFRDPSGSVFLKNGQVYRQVNRRYQEDYDLLINSGLYDSLVRDGLLIPHTEDDIQKALSQDAYKVIKPHHVPFISYPYEWCFSQLKRAALLTLTTQEKALKFGMSLKDSSAYNIQFLGARPILIDTLSFEEYREGQPWVAYRQYCQHFLGPLALMGYADVRLHQLLRAYLDGIPLDLVSALLPARTRFKFSLLSHIHLHAKAQKQFANRYALPKHRTMSQTALLGLIDSLRSATEYLRWKPADTEWHDYYTTSNYSTSALEHKKQLVAEMLDAVEPNPASVWDLGANTGLFSRIASTRGIPSVAFDMDPAAVEINYLDCVAKGETNLLPLVLDITNPSAGLGWENQERMSLLDRAPVDVALALALVHHLAISNNLPLHRIARFLGQICRSLLIEFVPKTDPQVQKLLASREDIFEEYNQEAFEAAFNQCFVIQRQQIIADTPRCLYLMVRRSK
jgi:ribosomal protein L11 methylase PrmA